MTIMASLFKSGNRDHRLRLCLKFSENDFEKLDRLLEMHDQYTAKMALADKQYNQNRDDEEVEDEDERYLNRLDKGLFTLQLVDLVAAYICTEVSEDTVGY
jgi:beta-catenin-like protein 1